MAITVILLQLKVRFNYPYVLRNRKQLQRDCSLYIHILDYSFTTNVEIFNTEKLRVGKSSILDKILIRTS